jgi:hypothetical protein
MDASARNRIKNLIAEAQHWQKESAIKGTQFNGKKERCSMPGREREQLDRSGNFSRTFK